MDTMEENRSLNDKFMLRMPDGMRERIKTAATTTGRSMNSEILSVLEMAFPPLPSNIENSLNMIKALSLDLAASRDLRKSAMYKRGIEKHYALLKKWTDSLSDIEQGKDESSQKK